jgi:uncharacterized membrane protein YhaH (DUF805 family)
MSEKVWIPSPLRPLSRFLFSYKGRAGNAVYILYQIALFPFLKIFYGAQGGMDPRLLSTAQAVPIAILGTFIIWSYTAVLGKRMHDCNLSLRWWLFCVLGALIFKPIPYYAGIALAFFPGDKGPNGFGPPPAGVKEFLRDRKLARLGRDFIRGKMSAEELNTQRASILASEVIPSRGSHPDSAES